MVEPIKDGLFICNKPFHFLVFKTTNLFCYNFIMHYFYFIQKSSILSIVIV